MDIRRVERYILLHYRNPIMFIHGPMKRNFLNAGLLDSFLTLLFFRIAFAVSGYIELWAFVILVVAMVFVALLQIRLIKRSIIRNKFESAFPLTLTCIVGIGLTSGVSGRALGRVLVQQFPEEIYLMLWVLFITLGLLFFSNACSSFHKVFLTRKYCPYLILPEDRRYNEDIKDATLER